MSGRKLVSQEKGFLGEKKYHVQGIFGVKAEKARGKGGFLGWNEWLLEFETPEELQIQTEK